MNSSLFIKYLKAEYYKTKRNVAMLILLTTPVVLAIIAVVYMGVKYSDVTELVFPYNPWNQLSLFIIRPVAMLFPILVSLLSYSLYSMERENGCLKQLFTLPVGKHVIYIAKIIRLQEIIFFAVLVTGVIYLLIGRIAEVLMPNYLFQNYDTGVQTLHFALCMLISLWAIGMIQYFVSILLNSFVLSVGFSVFATIISWLLSTWKYIDYIPYYTVSYRAIACYNENSSVWDFKSTYINIGYIIIFTALTYIVFRKQKA